MPRWACEPSGGRSGKDGCAWSFPGQDRARDNRAVHRLYVPPEQLAGSERVKRPPARSRHLLAVLRLSSGAEIEVFDGIGGRFQAVLAGHELEIVAALPGEGKAVGVVLGQGRGEG